MEVFDLVFSSTRFTITAQYRDGLGKLSCKFFPGREPGTTTEYEGTVPICISPVARSIIYVEAPI